MNEHKSFNSILVPAATVFFSSACIMIIELVAGRLIARHLGSSLYTWTSVIGVVLAGITVGNYLGGHIADRFPARKALAVLLGISSVACVVIVILNNLIGEWIWLWKLNWPVHAFTHVFLVFMLPSTLLGTISPVVAKMALDRGMPTGRTVGDIYAFGAAGSIAGTFLAGFYLIAVMGTIAIIWTVAAALLLMAIMYRPRFWPLYIWAAIFIALMTMGMAPQSWAESAGSSLALREEPNPAVLYEDESQYSYIAVRRTSETMDRREFILDKLTHSKIVMDNIFDLQYPYENIYAAATQMLARDKSTISALIIGGGGYVFPRYLEKVWPGSRIDVAEIDPRVTEAAMLAFGLDRNTSINTFAMDARNYVDELLHKKQTAGQISRYDFIYEDAINDYSVPYQLTTKEFNDEITQILTDDGVYMVNLLDIYDSGLFLGAVVKTLQQTFPCVYVVAADRPRSIRNTFVIIASMREVNLENLTSEKQAAASNLRILNNSEIETLKNKSHEIILTDDYAPVENMLAPVVRQSAADSLSGLAQELKRRGKLDESVAVWKQLIETNPIMAVTAYKEIAAIRLQQNRLNEAVQTFQQAIQCNEKAEVKIDVAGIHLDLAFLLKDLKQPEQSRVHLGKAIEGFRKILTKDPKSAQTLSRLGVALSEAGQFNEATEYLRQAADMNSLEVETHLALANALLMQQRYDEAVAALKKAIGSFSSTGDKEAVGKLQEYLWFIENNKKSK
ncbi:MAG: fused MFS/spermidine synthase [Phycisphaerae bacterium]|jgi:tetratricopeptide (TPR) repeat protein